MYVCIYVTIRLHVSDYSQLSDYTVRLQLCKLMQNRAVYAPITFEEIVIVMIRAVIVQLHKSYACN